MYNQTGCVCILTESYFVHLKLLTRLCVSAHLYMCFVILFSLRAFRYHCRMSELQLYRFIDLYYCVTFTHKGRDTIVGKSLGALADERMTVQLQLQTLTPTHICRWRQFTHMHRQSLELNWVLPCTFEYVLYICIFIHHTDLHIVLWYMRCTYEYICPSFRYKLSQLVLCKQWRTFCALHGGLGSREECVVTASCVSCIKSIKSRIHVKIYSICECRNVSTHINVCMYICMHLCTVAFLLLLLFLSLSFSAAA